MPLIRKPSPAPGTAPSAPDAPAVRRMLASDRDEDRWSAARAAAELADAVPLLRDALAREANPRVREALFTSLVRLGTPESVETVLPFLHSDDARVRTEACDALAAMASSAWPWLPALLRDPDPTVRIQACGLVRAMPPDDAVRLLSDLLESESNANVSAAAIDALAEIGGADALSALARCQQRFEATPFLAFASRVATDRIRAQLGKPRG